MNKCWEIFFCKSVVFAVCEEYICLIRDGVVKKMEVLPDYTFFVRVRLVRNGWKSVLL